MGSQENIQAAKVHEKHLTKKLRRGTGAGVAAGDADTRLALYTFDTAQNFSIPSGNFPANYPLNFANFPDAVIELQGVMVTPFVWKAVTTRLVLVTCFLELEAVAGLGRHVLHIRHKDDNERDAAASFKAVSEGSTLKMHISEEVRVYTDDEIRIGISVRNSTASALDLTLIRGQFQINTL